LTDDPFSLGTGLFIIFLLIFLNGFFVAAEFAIVRVRPTRIEQLVQEGNARARLTQRVIDDLYSFLPVTQLGVTLASLALGWVGERTMALLMHRIFDPFLNLHAATINVVASAAAFIAITFLHIVLGELAPKAFAIQKAERTALFSSWPLIVFSKVMYPAIWVLNLGANLFLKVLGVKNSTPEALAHNEDELRMVVSQSHQNGIIDETERTLFDNIFDFTTRVAREIMVPRTDMACLYANRSFQENLEKAEREKHTRYPLCMEDKDHIIGILHIKDLYSVALSGRTDIDLVKLARKPVTVPEAMPIKDVLHILQKSRSEIAIVIDEYGGTAGIVTTEDILEELVGEIQDEFDEERPFIEKINEETFSIDARMLIDEVNDYFNLDIRTEELDTIGGWVFTQFQNPPKVGAYVQVGTYSFQVAEMDSLRITRLHVTKISDVEAETVTA
jgi:CBS domain containing-hemolysin-like protein